MEFLTPEIIKKKQDYIRDIRLRSPKGINLTDYKKIIAKLSEMGSVSNELSTWKMMELQDLLHEQEPMFCLELGTGGTTHVFNEYSKKTGANVLSIDSDDKYIQNTKDAIGELAPKMRIEEYEIKSERLNIWNGFPLPTQCCFDKEYRVPYDFVFIDAPPLQVQGMINTDIFKILKYHSPKTIVVDIRIDTVYALMAYYGNEYDVTVTEYLYPQYTNSFNYLSVFRKKSLEKFDDGK